MAAYICTVCGSEGKGRKTKRGSGKTEMIIWTVLLFPGPFYSAWRRIALQRICTHCSAPAMVKMNSDAGWITRRKVDIELGVIKPGKLEEKKAVEGFGNERPPEKIETKKPVNPDQW